jgi:hypothetical protein
MHRNLLVLAFLASALLAASCGSGGSSGSSTGAPANPAVPGPATQLVLTTQPAGALAGQPFTTQPVVRIRDAAGNTVTTDNATVVSAAIVPATGAAGAVLSGNLSVTAVAGVCAFTDLALSLAGTGYQLAFTSAPVLSPAQSSAFNVSTAGGGGTIIAPDNPPASQVNFTIHSQQDVRPISRFIYGMNGADFSGARPRNLTLSRSGGNRMTAYNWENNASNAGEDWFNQNDGFISSSNTPGVGVTPGITQAHGANASIIVTVPMIGYVAADKNGGGDVNQTPNYLATRFKQSVPKKGSAFTLAPDTSDGFVYQDEWVNFLDQTYPTAKTDANRTIFYSLDNEPDLWASTHPRLRGAATGSQGTGVTYADLVARTRDYADAIKDVVPQAIVFGPVNYGWQGMVDLQSASDAAGRDFLEYYLEQMALAETSYGKRLVDVLDIHWYPECGANNASGSWTRITSDNADPLVVAERLNAPRSLWDPTYTEASWVTQWSTLGPIELLPRMKQKIASKYPNTRIAVTEYNYGGANHISGGIAQADVLGIFGRDGVYAATLWKLSANNDYIHGGFEMFRNFDGANGSFGDTSIRAQNSDTANTSVYASVDAANPNRMVIVCINRTASSRTAGIQVSHTVKFNKASVHTLTSASSQPQAQAQINLSLTNALQYAMPAYSVTTLVLEP